jgi:hypothetical protein
MNNASQIEERINHFLEVRGAEAQRSIERGRTPIPSVLSMFCSLIVTGLLCVGLISDGRFGTYHDDSIYVTTAKALADGNGYRIISLPYEPAQTKYPPLYAALLSVVWRFHPNFPQNLNYMAALSVIITILFLMLGWAYLRNHDYAAPWSAVFVIALTALNWRSLILATSIFSEMLFALLSLASLYLAERYEKHPSRLAVGVALGLLMGMTFLTRSSGLALMISVALYFTVRKRWRQALLPLAIGSSFCYWLGNLVLHQQNKFNCGQRSLLHQLYKKTSIRF